MSPEIAKWQEYFDSRFPDGVLVTLAQNGAASAKADDSLQILAGRVYVTDVDEHDTPSIVVSDVISDRQFNFDVEKNEEDKQGSLVLTLADKNNTEILMSPNLADYQKELVQERKKGMFR